TPHHGGVVGMAGTIHLEARADASGRVRVWLTDYWRRPLPPQGGGGSGTVDPPEGAQTPPLPPRDHALEARGAPRHAGEASVAVALIRNGEPVEMDFILPIAAPEGGAASVPRRGCTPPTDVAEAARAPRCVLEFPRSVATISVTPDAGTALIGVVDAAVT